jgi:hypothetical protein
LLDVHLPLEQASRIPLANDKLALEIADRWVRRLRPMNWPERLAGLADLLEHLQEALGNMSRVGDVFPDIIANVVNKLGDPKIDCVEQAHVYATSKDRMHREAAGEWFRSHNTLPGDPQP